MFKTENEFSRSLSDLLTKQHIMVTKIESHHTANGIPDMFVCGRGLDCWIELKNDPKLSINNKAIKVDWRPGQVAWALEYFRKHTTKNSLTLVAASDGVFIIPMIHNFKFHDVYNPEGISYDDLKQFKLYRILEAMSEFWIKGKNYLDMINSFVDDFYPGIDYDPECLWNPDMLEDKADFKIFNSNKLNMILTLESTILN